ncbi:MAG: hypothetical protein ACYCOU_00720 [Sulfobacillus sp.]
MPHTILCDLRFNDWYYDGKSPSDKVVRAYRSNPEVEVISHLGDGIAKVVNLRYNSVWTRDESDLDLTWWSSAKIALTDPIVFYHEKKEKHLLFGKSRLERKEKRLAGSHWLGLDDGGRTRWNSYLAYLGGQAISEEEVEPRDISSDLQVWMSRVRYFDKETFLPGGINFG